MMLILPVSGDINFDGFDSILPHIYSKKKTNQKAIFTYECL